MDKIELTDDQNDELQARLSEGVCDEDGDDVVKLLVRFGVPGQASQEVGDLVTRVGNNASEVGGCFCFSCPYTLTESIDELETKLKEVFTEFSF